MKEEYKLSHLKELEAESIHNYPRSGCGIRESGDAV